MAKKRSRSESTSLLFFWLFLATEKDHLVSLVGLHVFAHFAAFFVVGAGVASAVMRRAATGQDKAGTEKKNDKGFHWLRF
jgi:hypothetical protein